MPIDPMMLNAILGTFKNMIEECKTKNLSGSDFDKMCETYARMEQLGNEHSDFNEYNAQLMNENLYGKFSDFYGRILTAEANAQSDDGGGYDDAAMLKQNIDALKQAIVAIRKSYQDTIEQAKGQDTEANMQMGLEYIERNIDKEILSAAGGLDNIKSSTKKDYEETIKKKPNAFDNSVEVEVMSNPEVLIKPIQDIIDLGEKPGMTLPRFLRLQIETGLDKAMEGSVSTRNGLETQKEFILSNPISPIHIQVVEQKLEKFDELANANKFKVPNSTELKYAFEDIERLHENDIQKWDQIKTRWNDLLGDLSFWSLSYCSFAPYIQPWASALDPVAATKKTQNTSPGIFKEREKLFQKYFGISFYEIFKQPTFLWEVKYNYIDHSQEFVEFLIEKIYPECKPFNHLSHDLIEQRGLFCKRGKDSKDREANPQSHFPLERMIELYDKKYGTGRYHSKYDAVEKNESAAKPWDLSSFKH
ncbi:MAG: hypothetical protein RBR97_04565 [Bacteroidales bacterium]|nr:hypothetical protein [Bacteroidales bacterium]